MFYDRIQAPSELDSLVDCYWIIEDDDAEVTQQKILPDGFPEIIFHYGDPYQVNITGDWETQPKLLVAGQIRNHFLLRNTGRSGMIGIKLSPTALTELFSIDMSQLSNKVVGLLELPDRELASLGDILSADIDNQSKITKLNQYLIACSRPIDKNAAIVRLAIEKIRQSNGMIGIAELQEELEIKERTLERLFKKFVGLSPKFYSRIIRFNYVFRLVSKQKLPWSELAQLAGFYDQSHFNNNFREFVGEEPSKYYFVDDTMANFHLNRPD